MQRIRILIVEDETIVALDLQQQLVNFGYQITGHVLSGEDALDRARSLQPDLVMMDIHLKGSMDGIEAASIIRNEMDIPVVFLTAYTDKSTLERAIETDTYGYIVKPYQSRDLKTQIEIALYKHRMENRLKYNEQWLNGVVNSMSDPVFASDTDGLIYLVNRAGEKLTGDSVETLKGLSLEEYLKDKLKYRDIPDSGIPHYVLADDRKSPSFEKVESHLKDRKGRRLGTLVVLHDISKSIVYEQELNKAKELSERASRAKSDFLATVSHELRNPLNTILGFTGIELESASSPETEKNLTLVRQAAESLLDIINNMITLSRTGMPGQQNLNSSEVDLHLFFGNLAEQYRNKAIKRGLDFQVTISRGTPQRASVYPDLVKQIVIKLLENSLKYTKDGFITLAVEARRDVSDSFPGVLSIAVRDSGCGFSAEEKERVFEPFRQKEEVYTRNTGGAGLGLPVVKHIIEILGGNIDVESRPDEGSRFTVHIPVQAWSGEVLKEDRNICGITEDEKSPPGKKSGLQNCEKNHTIEDRYAAFLAHARETAGPDTLATIERDAAGLRGAMAEDDSRRELLLKIILVCRRGNVAEVLAELGKGQTD